MEIMPVLTAFFNALCSVTWINWQTRGDNPAVSFVENKVLEFVQHVTVTASGPRKPGLNVSGIHNHRVHKYGD